jgi:hypothetical protein
MTSNTELYEKLLEKYRVSAPLPDRSRDEVLARKRDLYKKVMKRKGAYGMAIAVISYLFFFLRRKGIEISFLQSALITAAAAGLLALSAAGGIYLLVKGIEAPVIEETEKNEEDRGNSITPPREKVFEQSGKAVTEQKQTPEKHGTSTTRVQTIRYQVLKADKDHSAQAALLTGKIIARLKKQHTHLRLIPAGSKKGGAPGTILIGSLESDGKSYSVTTKLVDLKSGKVLFMDHQAIPINENSDKSAETMAKSISGMLAELNRKD